MNSAHPLISDPFRCYVGSKVILGDHPHVVECHELHGQRLLFRVREIGSGRSRRISMLELLDALERQGV